MLFAIQCVALVTSFTVASGASLTTPRVLSESAIAGYVPLSQVTDHNAIDLDQQMIEMLLSEETDESFNQAWDIYDKGANSKSYAKVLLNESVSETFPAGTTVSGLSTEDKTIDGKLYSELASGTRTMEIQYATSGIQENYVECRVGSSQTPMRDGCFAAAGNININTATLAYSYDPTTENLNGRTIQGFSTNDQKHRVNSDPNQKYYDDFQKFVTYYGSADYADKWITSALSGSSTGFTGSGNADFSQYPLSARSQAIKKGTVFMAIAMYVIRELEDALDDCNRECSATGCNDDPVNALDEAVAFYTGSLEGADGSGDGLLMYALADKRCTQFNTCGELGGSDDARLTSKVNNDIFKQFFLMKDSLNARQCDAARRNKERIVSLLFIPLIQGTIRYAFLTETLLEVTDDDEAEGAVFAASVLPMVAFCNEDAADTIYNNMKTGSGRADFNQVKSAFESTYACMKVKCEDVGGYWDVGNSDYYPGAQPCSGGSGVNTGLAVGLAFGAAALVVLAVVMLRRRRSSDVEFKADGSGQV